MATFTQWDLDAYKAQYPDDAQIQALTLDQVNTQAADVTIDFDTVEPISTYSTRSIFTPCQAAMATVVFDAIFVAIGYMGLRKSLKKAAVEAMIDAIEPAVPKIEKILSTFSSKDASFLDGVIACVQILSAIYSADCIGAVISKFLGTLTWWNAILYGITALATIVTLIATDGLALIAEAALLAVNGAFLIEDLVKACQICSQESRSAPPPTPDFVMPSGTGGLRTFTHSYLGAVNGGGLVAPTNAINTDATSVADWEKFTIVPVDAEYGTFALRTAAGGYLTAVRGGALGGPDTAACPIHSDATSVSAWQSFTIVDQGDGTCAFRTSSNFYLSAQNGGNVDPGTGDAVVRTDGDSIGAFQMFSFVA